MNGGERIWFVNGVLKKSKVPGSLEYLFFFMLKVVLHAVSGIESYNKDYCDGLGKFTRVSFHFK